MAPLRTRSSRPSGTTTRYKTAFCGRGRSVRTHRKPRSWANRGYLAMDRTRILIRPRTGYVRACKGKGSGSGASGARAECAELVGRMVLFSPTRWVGLGDETWRPCLMMCAVCGVRCAVCGCVDRIHSSQAGYWPAGGQCNSIRTGRYGSHIPMLLVTAVVCSAMRYI